MKKIIFIHHGASIGGAPLSMLELAGSIDDTKYNVLIVFTCQGPMVDIAKKKGFHTKVLAQKSIFMYGAHIKIRFRMIIKFLWNYFSTIKSIDYLIKQENPSLIYLNTSVLITSAIAIKKNKIPLIWSIREVPGKNLIIRNWMIGKIENLSDHIFVTSNFVKNYFKKFNKISVMYNSVNIAHYKLDRKNISQLLRKQFNILNDSTVLCLLGSVQKEKGHFLLIDAIKNVIKVNNNIKVLIVCGGVDGDYRNSWKGIIKKFFNLPLDNLDKLKNFIFQQNLNDYFIFTGYRTDIPDILCVSDILLFPSLLPEGFGRPIIEGMASGIPVIASDIGPSREILGKKSGVLFQNLNTKDLSDAIIKLISNPAMRNKFGKAGLKRVSKNFNSNDMRLHFNNILDKQLEKRNE